ncbi:TonB-dependent receptor [Pseudoduganella albidiflava]|uniref:TonB-dependent receptor n=1 Tax=Pseudoduganella albidiflava TaxID=321983 RepID=A0A411WRV1_9BURK|nr:TonB-dependent receptor [Pseudoduganella albidiflava]QBH99510.1 TonB-dependent receptor [Pseudoduganella albidiflava]GGY45412.1 TonB-dependent receptor [Pseudoduganella albidiflava]
MLWKEQRTPLALAAALLAAGAAHAQEGDGGKLESVVVTANKRVQNLQDVPASITVLGDAVLQRSNVRELDDLPSLSPALTLSYGTQPGNFSINMRGVGTFSLGIGVEADVAVIVDDIPLGMQANAFKDLADVHRIEVLKGPQSTLFGKSSIAGALNITTKPIGGPVKTSATLLATNDHEWRAGVSVSGAVSDTFRMRIAASKTDYDGTLDNLTTGGRLNGSKGDNLNAKFEWQPLDNLTFTLSPRYNRTEKFCCTTAFTSMTPGGLYRNAPQLPQSVVLRDIHIAPGNRGVRNDYPTGGKFRDWGVGFKVDYGLAAGHTLSSISSYGKYHMDDYQDNDATDIDILQYLTLQDGSPTGMHGGLYQYGQFNVKSTTQEFRLTSPDQGTVRYVVGLWYGKNDLNRELAKAPLIFNYGTNYGADAWNVNKAVYGQGTWDLRPDTSLIVGARWNDEDTGYNYRRYTVPPQAFALTEFYTKSDSNSSKTWKLGLEHRLTRDAMVYGTVSTGHKGVAYDLTSGFTAALAAKPAVPPETARSYELGWKQSLWDNRAMFSMALFRTEFRNFQQSAGFFDYDGIFRTALNSLGGLRTQGLEVEGSVRATPRLQLNGSFAYTEATITEFRNGPCYNVLNAAGTAATPGPGCFQSPEFNNTNVQDLAGKTLPNAPKVKLNLGGQYDVPLASLPFNAFISGTTRFQSRTQYSLNQDPMTIQGAYAISNLSVGATDKRGRWKASLFVNNLFDKRYAAGLNNSIANGTWSPKAPNAPRAVNTTEWLPPRDWHRYFGVRADMTF